MPRTRSRTATIPSVRGRCGAIGGKRPMGRRGVVDAAVRTVRIDRTCSLRRQRTFKPLVEGSNPSGLTDGLERTGGELHLAVSAGASYGLPKHQAGIAPTVLTSTRTESEARPSSPDSLPLHRQLRLR